MTTDDGKKIDYVQELLNQVMPRMRSFMDTAGNPQPNSYQLIGDEGSFNQQTSNALEQFKHNFQLAGRNAAGQRTGNYRTAFTIGQDGLVNYDPVDDDTTDTFRKLTKDYGRRTSPAVARLWLHKIVDKETLVGATRRIPDSGVLVTAENADARVNAPGSLRNDTGLYELYKNVVERFVDKMIAEGELYRQSRGSNYPQASTSWRARTGETVTESESYCFGCKDRYDEFWPSVSRRRACEPNVAGTYPTCSVNYNRAGCDAINTGYTGHVNDGTGAYNGTKQYPGLKKDEYDLWHDTSNEVDCSGDARFNPLHWAGIDCSGFVQRVVNFAEFEQGVMTTAWNINTQIGDIRTSLQSAIGAQTFFSAEKVAYWANPDMSDDRVFMQQKLRRGDLVRYGNIHNSIVLSDSFTCDDGACAYEIIHASGDNRVCYGLPGEAVTCTGFNRKVTANDINNRVRGTLGRPTGFGRIKLWD